MTTINFKDRTEQIEIAGKVYDICVSKYDFIKKAQASLQDLENAQKLLNENGKIDTLLNACETFINLVLDNDYDRIWDECGHDIYNLLDVATAMGAIIQKGLEYKAKKYV